MRGWLIAEGSYQGEYATTVQGEGRNISRIVTRLSAVRTRVNPATGEEREQVWTPALGWHEGGDA